jgi:hypothetical protein
MKKISAILSVMGILFFISGRVTAQAVIKPPMRTADLSPAVQHTAPVALPIKNGGGGAKTITSAQPGAVKATLPPIRSGSTAGPGGNKAIPARAGSAKLPVKGAAASGLNK